MTRCWLLLAIFCGLLGVAALAPASDAALDPLLPYQARRLDPVTYDVDFSVVVTPPYQAKKLAVWLPVPPSDAGQEISDSRFSTFPLSVEPRLATEEKYGNRFAYFEIASPQGAQIIRHQFRIKVWELRWDVEPQKLTAVFDWPASFDKYRQSDSQAVLLDARFRRVLDEIVPPAQQQAASLADVMLWVESHFAYDHKTASLQANAEHGLLQRRGHCSDYHSFCASLGRALGVPTRVTYGINPFPKNSPSHCKLEAFLPPHGWVSFDVSETQKLVAAIRQDKTLDDAAKQGLADAANRRLIGGFRDNTWFLQTRGTDYDLAPPASKRVPVVRTAWIEADGVPLAEPDPAAKGQAAFSWMTVHSYKPDRPVAYPFGDWKTLQTSPEIQP